MATSRDADLNKIVMMCDVCGVSMVGIVPYRAHINGRQHKRAEELAKNKALISTTTTTITAISGDYYCQICRKSMTGPEPYKQHIESAKHMKAASTTTMALQIPPVQITQTVISRMNCANTNTVVQSPDEYYINKHLTNVTVVEPNESIVDALSKMGYI